MIRDVRGAKKIAPQTFAKIAHCTAPQKFLKITHRTANIPDNDISNSLKYEEKILILRKHEIETRHAFENRKKNEKCAVLLHSGSVHISIWLR